MADGAGGFPPITLYTYALSFYGVKVQCFLNYKRIPFEHFYINPLRVKKDLPSGYQIPALKIGDEARNDSTPLGIWLDELCPNTPRLLPESGPEREKLLQIDKWCSDQLIPGTFRFFPGDGWNRWVNGWHLARALNLTARGGLPWYLRVAWPFILRRVGFWKRHLKKAHSDGLSLPDSKRRVYTEFVKHLEGGPFLGGRDMPSLPDFAAFPMFAMWYQAKYRMSADILEYPEIMTWLARIEPHATAICPLLPASLKVRDLPPLLEEGKSAA